MNKTAKKKFSFQNNTSFIKITINKKGGNEEVYDTMVALKERGSPGHYGSELMVLQLHLVLHSSQVEEITELFSLSQTPAVVCPNPCSGQAQTEKAAQGHAQSHCVLKASKDGEPAVLPGSLCAGEK